MNAFPLTNGIWICGAVALAVAIVVSAAILKALKYDPEVFWGIGLVGAVVWPIAIPMGIVGLAMFGLYCLTLRCAEWVIAAKERRAAEAAQRETELRASGEAPVKGGHR